MGCTCPLGYHYYLTAKHMSSDNSTLCCYHNLPTLNKVLFYSTCQMGWILHGSTRCKGRITHWRIAASVSIDRFLGLLFYRHKDNILHIICTTTWWDEPTCSPAIGGFRYCGAIYSAAVPSQGHIKLPAVKKLFPSFKHIRQWESPVV